MRASEFEFRHRFWFITAVFTAGFCARRFDPVNVVAAAVQGLGVPPGTPAFASRERAVFAGGAVLTVLAAAIRTWAAAYLSSGVIHDRELHAETLVADGPYRHVRNPLYLGLLLLALGLALAASRIGFVIIVGGMLVVTWRLIGREEAELSRTQGAAFAAYCRAVPRLLPALAPRLPAAGRRPRLGQALLGESFFWLFAVASIAFVATGDGRLAGRLGLGGVLLYALLLPVWLRRRRAPPPR